MNSTDFLTILLSMKPLNDNDESWEKTYNFLTTKNMEPSGSKEAHNR